MTPIAVEAQVGLPDLGDAGEAGEAQRQSVPEPRFDLLALTEARPQRDQQRCHVFEEQRDADRQRLIETK